MKPTAKLQIGKNKLTQGFMQNLENAFKTRENVKIHLLKSTGHDRKQIKNIAEQLTDKLGKKYTYKIIGFTICLKKWRKSRK